MAGHDPFTDRYFAPWLCVRNTASGFHQIDRKLGKCQWRHNFLTWLCFVSLVNFSYCSKFHVNIIIFFGSGVMTISFYKGLTRNPEIGNTIVWVLPNIWRLGQVRNTKFGTNISNKMLLDAAKCQGYRFYISELSRENKPTEGLKLPPPFHQG